jgi:hypothetical protein
MIMSLKLIAAELMETFPYVFVACNFFTLSQEPATVPCLEPVESSSHSQIKTEAQTRATLPVVREYRVASRFKPGMFRL